MGKKWTDKEDDVLVTMRDAGTSYREIASSWGAHRSHANNVCSSWVKPSRTQSTPTAAEKQIESGAGSGPCNEPLPRGIVSARSRLQLLEAETYAS